jgi:hypothetical protein
VGTFDGFFFSFLSLLITLLHTIRTIIIIALPPPRHHKSTGRRRYLHFAFRTNVFCVACARVCSTCFPCRSPGECVATVQCASRPKCATIPVRVCVCDTNGHYSIPLCPIFFFFFLDRFSSSRRFNLKQRIAEHIAAVGRQSRENNVRRDNGLLLYVSIHNIIIILARSVRRFFFSLSLRRFSSRYPRTGCCCRHCFPLSSSRCFTSRKPDPVELTSRGGHKVRKVTTAAPLYHLTAVAVPDEHVPSVPPGHHRRGRRAVHGQRC